VIPTKRGKGSVEVVEKDKKTKTTYKYKRIGQNGCDFLIGRCVSDFPQS
jgi:hypothetical protein